MPTLEERINKLYLKTGDVITEEWYGDLTSLLKDLSAQSAVDYAGYVHRHLIPEIDLAFRLGIEDRRFLSLHAGYGYFAYEVHASDVKADYGCFTHDVSASNVKADYGYFNCDAYIQGKRILKDGDPIYVADLYTPAREKITHAIDYAYITDYLATIKSDVEALLALKKFELLGIQVDYQAPALAKVFDPDLEAKIDGKVRLKIASEYESYGYLTWLPSGLAQEVEALLNLGEPLKPKAWHEFDFTVKQGDKVNVKFYPGSRVTVAVYNLREG